MELLSEMKNFVSGVAMPSEISISTPPARIRYSLSLVNDKLYLFGGTSNKHATYWNDVFILDTINWTWFEPNTCTGDIPTPRYGHSATCMRDKNTYKIILFGGKAIAPNNLQNDVTIFDTSTMTWKKIEVAGEAPSPRYYHTATYIGDGRILVFGGRGSSGELNDIHILNTTEWKWIQPSFEERQPSKRYQHSAHWNSMNKTITIYGGINKMSALQDIYFLELDTMQWVKGRIENEMAPIIRAHEYTIFVEDEGLLIIDFDTLWEEQSIFHLSIHDHNQELYWKRIQVTGEIPPNSQYYSFVSLSHDKHIFLELGDSTVISILDHNHESLLNGEVDMISIPVTASPLGQEHPKEDAETNQAITIECHYASKPWHTFQINKETSFHHLQHTIQNSLGLDYIEMIASKKNEFFTITTDTMGELSSDITNNRIRVYVAQSVPIEAIKKERINFLADEAIQITHEDSINRDTESSYKKRRKSVDKSKILEYPMKDRKRHSLPDTEENALPKLYGKPVNLSLIRKVHKKMKQLEGKGLYHCMLSPKYNQEERTALLNGKHKKHGVIDEFRCQEAFITFIQLALLPLTTIYTILQPKFSNKAKGIMVLLSLIHMSCVALPILAKRYGGAYYEKEIQGAAILYSPVAVVILLCLIMATIEGSWKNHHKFKKELSKYQVTIWQALITNQYGERHATGDDVLFALTDKEETTKDSTIYKFITFGLSLIGAFLHSLVTLIYLIQTKHFHLSHSWYVHGIAMSAILLNFITVFIYLFLLGVSLAAFGRQLTFIRYFGMITSRNHAESADLPTLPLQSIENAMAWMKIRGYIKGHQFLPLTVVHSILGWSLIIGITLWISVVFQVFTSEVFFTEVTSIIFNDALLMAIYIIGILWIGAKINASQEKHLNMLYKEQLRLSLQVRGLHDDKKNKIAKEKSKQLEDTKEFIEIFANMIEQQEQAFHLLGLSLGEGTIKVIIGFVVSLTVATAAHLEFDLSIE